MRRLITAVPAPVLLAAAVVAVLVAGLLASALIAPASAGQPLTLYVDGRIGSDDFDGRAPERALATLDAAIEQARPGADILITGYDTRLPYRGTGTDCVTLVGTPEQPVTIRRNVYTNTLYPAMISVDRQVDEKWVRERRAGEQITWSTPWPGEIVLSGDPDLGFVKIGQLALHGYIAEPPLQVGDAAWWADGRVYVRTTDVNPNGYATVVKDGDGLCISGQSKHVRIKDLSVRGAVHAIRVEDGARDIEISHLVRYNVLDPDLIAPSADQRRGKGTAATESTQ